jgi:hypothetical protein
MLRAFLVWQFCSAAAVVAAAAAAAAAAQAAPAPASAVPGMQSCRVVTAGFTLEKSTPDAQHRAYDAFIPVEKHSASFCGDGRGSHAPIAYGNSTLSLGQCAAKCRAMNCSCFDFKGTLRLGTLRMPSFLSDNMVLQRGNASLWGWAAAGERIKVTVSAQGGSVLATATGIARAGDGAWAVSLQVPGPLPSSSIAVLAEASNASLQLANVAFGDVFLCSGQSNMVYPVADAENGAAERAASTYPDLRLLTLRDATAAAPATDVLSSAPYTWAASAPSALSAPRAAPYYPSAACWFAGRDVLLSQNSTVPIGLITSAWSGKPIEEWMTPPMMADGTPPSLGGNGTCGGTGAGAAAAAAAAVAPPASAASAPHGSSPARAGADGGIFNGMIAPLLPMRLRGVWWYQVTICRSHA